MGPWVNRYIHSTRTEARQTVYSPCHLEKASFPCPPHCSPGRQVVQLPLLAFLREENPEGRSSSGASAPGRCCVVRASSVCCNAGKAVSAPLPLAEHQLFRW